MTDTNPSSIAMAVGDTLRGIVPRGTMRLTPAQEQALDRAEEKAAEEKAARERVWRLEAIGVPRLYAEATLENFELSQANAVRNEQLLIIRRARRFVGCWLERFEPDGKVPAVVVMVGPSGTGKGHVMWSIVKAIVGGYEANAVVCSLPDMVRDLRATWDGAAGQGESEIQRLRRYRLADLLVIDEVSRHAFYGDVKQHVYQIVDWRQQRRLPTILTTNEPTSELMTLLGTALVSRVLEGAGVWTFVGPDYRAQKGERIKAADVADAGVKAWRHPDEVLSPGEQAVKDGLGYSRGIPVIGRGGV